MSEELDFVRDDAAELINAHESFVAVIGPLPAAKVKAVAVELLRLTNPAPFDEQWLREEAGFERRPQSEGLFRGRIWATQSYNGWWFNVQDPKAGHYLVNPQPQTRGDVFQLIERVEREKSNG